MADPSSIRAPLSSTAPGPVSREAQFGISEDDLHELRVRIPLDLHRQLLSLKILRGRSLAETVSIALDVYFAQRDHETQRREPSAEG